MAVDVEEIIGSGPVTKFSDWYDSYGYDERRDCIEFRDVSKKGVALWRAWDHYKREMDMRVGNYELLEKLANGEVISPKPDLPNISSGETAGIVRRVAKSCVQNTPNVEIISQFDDDGLAGIFTRQVLKKCIIGSDEYSNDMQQNLFASVKQAYTLGFDCVLPVLLQDAGGYWYMKYDPIHYRDVFPEPGIKDVRQSPTVFIRRYLTEGEVQQLITDRAVGWDLGALKRLLQNGAPAREAQSVDHQTKKRHQIPKGYEIITWYTSSGENFLTFEGSTKMLLRIEKNKHPLKEHPVHFLVLEKDSQQPLGKSQVELILGRQDFQDLMLNGAMKLWYRNINPSIIGYGTVNAVPNLSPGKYTQISNPNAKIEAFEVNTQTLMQYGLISQQNLGSMVNLVGAPDQQMQQAAGNGMSATPQGVEAQTTVVDINLNNFQKAVESFFSHYCSYAMTIYFQEMKAVKSVEVTAETRQAMVDAGLDPKNLIVDGRVDLDFEDLAIQYFVRCVPGSLVELEDEKQLRILNELFIPLSQAMPAIANSGDPEMIKRAVQAMSFIVQKQIELSGASSAVDIGKIWANGRTGAMDEREERVSDVELVVGGLANQHETEMELTAAAIQQLQEQMSMMIHSQGVLLEKLGAQSQPPVTGSPVQQPVTTQVQGIS